MLEFQDFADTPIVAGTVLTCPSPADEDSDNVCFTPGQILLGVAFTDNPGPSVNGLALFGSNFMGFGNPSKILTNNIFTDAFEVQFDDGDTDTVGMELGCLNNDPNANPCALQVDVHGPGDLLLGTYYIVATNLFNTFLGVESDQEITRIVVSEDFMLDARGLLFILFGIGGTGGGGGCAIAGAGVGPEGLAGLAVLSLIPLFIIVRRKYRRTDK